MVLFIAPQNTSFIHMKKHPTKPSTFYRCPACRGLYRRAGGKAWIASYCSKTGRNVRLQRQKP